MSMIRALALMGTGAENFVQGGRDEEAAQRLRSAETFTQQQRQFQLAQQQRVLDQQAADSAAAAPVAPAPDMAPTPDGSQVQRMLPDPSGDNIDAGQPGTAPPIPAQRVGSQGGMMPAQAAAAAAAANTPEAIQARQIANRQATNPAEAASMQTAANQAKLAKVQLASQLFDSDLNKAASSVTVGDWTPLEETLKSSGATGAKFSTKFVPSTDGKTVEANIVMPDGSLKPTGKVYPNGPDGALQAASFLSQATPIEAKVAHSLAASKEGREEAAQQSLSRYHDSLAKYHDSLAEAANKRGDAALAKAGAGTRADHFDEKEWDAATKIEPSFVTFDDPLGGKGVESPELRLAYRSELNGARASGTMSPNEAAEQARTVTLQLKNAATSMVEKAKKDDEKSTLTEPQAVKQIMAGYAAAQRAKAAASAAPVVSPPVLAVPAPPPAPAAGMQAVAAPAAAPQAAPAEGPPPPPVPFLDGNRNKPNPAYVMWQRTYGQAWDEWRAGQGARDAAESAAAQARIDAARGSAPVNRGNV